MVRNDKTPLGCYIIIFIFLFIFVAISNCNDNERNAVKQKELEKSNQKLNAYVKKFDINFEEMTKNIENVNHENIQKSIPKKPIIIFQKRTIDKKNSISFNYYFNYRLEDKFMSFKNSEIKTIVLISDTLINIGHYSGTQKIGFKNNIVISYIDKKTNRIIFKDVIEGEEPPQEIKYRERDKFDEVYGKRPSEEEIFKRILTNIK
jgi:hypothetical protein